MVHFSLDFCTVKTYKHSILKQQKQDLSPANLVSANDHREEETQKLTWMPFWEVITSRSREGNTQNAACLKETRFLYFYDTAKYSLTVKDNIVKGKCVNVKVHLIFFCFYELSYSNTLTL